MMKLERRLQIRFLLALLAILTRYQGGKL